MVNVLEHLALGLTLGVTGPRNDPRKSLGATNLRKKERLLVQKLARRKEQGVVASPQEAMPICFQRLPFRGGVYVSVTCGRCMCVWILGTSVSSD